MEGKTPADAMSAFWAAAPSFAWFFLIVILLVVFRKEIKGLFGALGWRLKSGASLKIASFELGSAYVSANNVSVEVQGIESKPDQSGVRYEERRRYYEPNRKIMLAHKIAPSKQQNQLYDILLYLVPHGDSTLSSVQRVEYYFGKHWGNQIFTSIDRAQSFQIATSAYGSFMCTAELHFTDGEKRMISRYVDFEMGSIGK